MRIIALTRLAECYEGEEKASGVFAVWERLVKIDYEEADIVKRSPNAKTGWASVKMLSIIIKRHFYAISAKASRNVRELWLKLVDYCPEDIDFSSMSGKIAPRYRRTK